MNIDELCEKLNPDIIEKFKTAIEIGQWPDGRKLTLEQKETCVQAVIAYEHKFLEKEQRTGYIPPKGTACEIDDSVDVNAELPVTWK